MSEACTYHMVNSIFYAYNSVSLAVIHQFFVNRRLCGVRQRYRKTIFVRKYEHLFPLLLNKKWHIRSVSFLNDLNSSSDNSVFKSKRVCINFQHVIKMPCFEEFRGKSPQNQEKLQKESVPDLAWLSHTRSKERYVSDIFLPTCTLTSTKVPRSYTFRDLDVIFDKE